VNGYVSGTAVGASQQIRGLRALALHADGAVPTYLDNLDLHVQGMYSSTDYLVPRLTVGIFGGYWGIFGDKKAYFLRIIKSLILIV
jgi:hypothetical protein